MNPHLKYRRIFFFVVLIILIFSMVHVPIGEARGGTSSTNAAPVITLGENGYMTINENTQGTIKLTATDANKDTMKWSVTKQGNLGQASLGAVTNSRGTSTATVTYTPVSSGTDTFAVTVSDGKTNGTDTINITVTIKLVISYVALGDSIATGTTYPGNVTTSYVSHFYTYLQQKYPQATVTKVSFATDGDRTNELFNRLGLGTTAADSSLISGVTNADVITLGIGGNNLMQATQDSSSLGGYNFNKINTSVADQGLVDFQKQWVPIINEIKFLNSDVLLITTTTYNPYNELGTDASLHSTVDSYLSRPDGEGINDYIINNSGSLGYSVADVYQYFDDNYKNDMGKVTYFYPTDFWGTLTRNPHPNESGQDFITNLCKSAFETSGYYR